MTEQTRRRFCAQACQIASAAAMAGSMGTLLQACGGGGSLTGGSLPPNVPALSTLGATTVDSGGVTVNIDPGSLLAAVGSAALIQSPSGLILVAHAGADTFTAFSATCTHENCTITGFTGQAFVCPCHGSRFGTSGVVQNGPATRSLRSFATRFARNVLTISV